MTCRRAPSTVPSAAGSQRTARPRLRPLGVRVLAEPFSANVKVQARLVGTDAHVLGTERLLQCILGHLGQHLGHHLNFAQLLAVDASLLSKEGSRQQQGARAERRYYTSTYCTLLPLSLVYGIYPLTFLWCAV